MGYIPRVAQYTLEPYFLPRSLYLLIPYLYIAFPCSSLPTWPPLVFVYERCSFEEQTSFGEKLRLILSCVRAFHKFRIYSVHLKKVLRKY